MSVAMQHEYAASAWAVICRMGNVLVVDELNGMMGIDWRMS